MVEMFTVGRAELRGPKLVLHCREPILAANHIDDLLLFAETTRYPARAAKYQAAEVFSSMEDHARDTESRAQSICKERR
jgi:hypothetical protein